MRFPEDKIKAAILDADRNIRQRAIDYFSSSHSTDCSIMPLVIKAVETFGRHDAYRMIGLSRALPQTQESIAWIIDELNNEESDRHENYTYNLSMVLVGAAATLLLPRESDILNSSYFFDALSPAITERSRMLSWDKVTCWQNLEKFCEEGKDKTSASTVNLSYGRRIVEALARYPDECEEQVHSILNQTTRDYRNNSKVWMELLVVRLAGQARLESTIPLIISTLTKGDDDLFNEQCAKSLTQIGTPAVVEAIAREYPNVPRHARLYAIEALENIHSDLAVEKCLHLLPMEKDQLLRYDLAHALLSQMSYSGIEEARKLIGERQVNSDGLELRNYLVETCTLMGERIPEYDEWLAIELARKAEHERHINELEGDPQAMMLFALNRLAERSKHDLAVSLEASRAKESVPVAAKPIPPSNAVKQQRVGRNDPCPCGSGKKFKQCCIKQQS